MRRAARDAYFGAVRIAHLSDLHLLSLEGAVPYRLFNKRITGYLNLRFHRKSVHKPRAVRAAARAIKLLGIDHVVITGDELRRRVGAKEDETLADLIARRAGNANFLDALRAVERAAFVDDADLDGAIDDALKILDGV